MVSVGICSKSDSNIGACVESTRSNVDSRMSDEAEMELSSSSISVCESIDKDFSIIALSKRGFLIESPPISRVIVLSERR